MNLKQKAKQIRRDVVDLLYKHKACHLGSCMSCIEILVALYYKVMKPEDKFISSEGHIAAALYCVLADKGFFTRKQLFESYATKGTKFLNLVNKEVPGVTTSTGSLGHGLPMAIGVALAMKYDNEKNRVFVMLSDGEIQSGTTWEGALFASHHKLNNLIALINNNRLQACGKTKEILNIEPLDEKFNSFGWNIQRVDGHNLEEIIKACRNISDKKPNIIICDTIKGKGISFAENSVDWHYWNLTPKLHKRALKDIC